MRLILRFWLTLATATTLGARAAPAQGPAASAEPGSELTVYLVTMGPGDQVWERFGHNAIWIRDHARGTDVAYNWGLFDLGQAGFLPRFLKGRMLYWMGGFDAQPMIEHYVESNRSVWAQELALTPAQRAALQHFVLWNERPENRNYRYDYYRDNCSTRVRDAIDRVLGGQIRAATVARPTGTTYRSHTQRLTQVDPAVYTGTMIAMGQPTDRPISAWEEMFLPMKVRDHIRTVHVADAHGREVPLVNAERQLFAARRAPEPERPSSFMALYLGVGVALGAALMLLGYAVARGRARARFALVALGGVCGVLAGVLGTALVGLWTLTDHVFAHQNENVFQFTPLPLALAVLLPQLVYRGRWSRAALWLCVAIAGLSAVGLLAQALPGFDQTNGEVIALALPVYLGLAWAVWRVGR